MTLLRRHRSFRRLWLAGLVSEAGDWLLAVALPVHVFQVTGSAAATSIVFLLGLVPAALLGPVAGTYVDRWDRRRTLVAVAVLQAGFLLPLCAAAGRSLGVLYAVMLVQTVLAQFSEPARAAYLPEVVDDDDLVAANGLLATGNNVARLVGAGAGGFLLQAAGIGGVALVDAASFGVAALLLAGAARRRPLATEDAGEAAAAATTVLTDLRVGITLVRADRRLRGIVGVFAIAGLAQGMFVVLHVVFVLERLGAPASAAGVLRGVQAIGGLVGGVVVAAAGARLRTDRLLAGSLLVMAGLAFVTWTLPVVTTALAVYVALFTLVGVPAVAFGAALTTFVQRVAPVAALGRMFGFGWSVFALLHAVGTAGAGALEGRVGLYPLLVVEAAVYAAAGLLALLPWARLPEPPAIPITAEVPAAA